jgi:hypothetical protein
MGEREYLVERKSRIAWDSEIVIQRNILHFLLRFPASHQPYPFPFPFPILSPNPQTKTTHRPLIEGRIFPKHSLTHKIP